MKILLAGAYDDQFSAFRTLFPTVDFVRTDGAEVDIAEADALIGMSRAPFDKVFTEHFLATNKSVRWAHAPGAGIDFYLFPNLATSSITLTNGKIIQGPEVAEHAVALTLCLSRRIGLILKGVTNDRLPAPIELRGKTAVVIGFGGIGMLVAERLSAFGMTVDVVTETGMPLVSSVRKTYFGDQLMVALPNADVVIMVAPLTPRSRNMLGREQFNAMKQDAYLVNVSRGGTVDLGALVEALDAGKFAGVGLDVTNPEPLPADHRIRGFERVIVTPHLAGRSDRFRERNYELITTNIRRFIAGLPLINIVDKVAGF
ncbi:MAG: D-2-hydroxyacid dehydrogenase [Nitrospirota bacterium]|nr:D-2-hydroxyacid dehydrogenase [Nitrospirota bacterium]